MKQPVVRILVIGLALLGLGSGVAIAQDERMVSLGTDGSIRLEPKLVQYTPTGLRATDEAQRYPEAIRQLVQEQKMAVTASTRVTESRMIGFLTWRQTTTPSHLLVREGDILRVRPATAIEAGQLAANQEVGNPFGLLAAVVLSFLALANWLVKDEKFAAALAAFGAALAAFTLAAFGAALAAFGAALAAFTLAAFGAAFGAALAAIEQARAFHWLSAISAGCMIAAVIMAL